MSKKSNSFFNSQNSIGEFTYAYSFNGKEKDGETELQDYEMRMYDQRLGRFLSVDQLAKKYPELTPYQFAQKQISGSNVCKYCANKKGFQTHVA
ncbi:hypothetical protein BH09BAC5_BH09BAC5_12530 [soil metagenome]